MKKATHLGECQVCGREQRLPGGVLSKHGYTKRWNFFQGTCPGSGHNPFETHTDVIERSIARAEGVITKLSNEITSLAEPITSAEGVPVHRYDVATASRFETTATLTLENNQIRITYPDGKGEWGNHMMFGSFVTELDRAVRILRDKRVRRAGSSLLAHRQYVEWQRARLAAWKPRELKPATMEGFLDKLNREAGL